MSTFMSIPVESLEEAAELPSATYRLDLDSGRILGRVDGIEAIKQAIRKALITPRFRCLIYSTDYGSEIKNTVIAGDATPEYIECDMPRLVEDALAMDERILNIRDFAVSIEGEIARVSFVVDTVFGETEIDEVI